MNFQNLPRGDTVIKRAIVPKLGALSFFDYSAIEPRTFAYYASKMGHPAMAKMVNEGVDPYTAVARLITGKDDVTKDERQHWKVFFLSLMYGGGVKTIMLQFGCDRKGARKMIDQFHTNFPAVRELQDAVAERAVSRGYIVGFDGRHLHPEQFQEHKMLNKLVQGSAAGIMKAAIVRVNGYLSSDGLDSHIVNVVHDDLWIDGPAREVGVLHQQVPFLMTPETMAEVVRIDVDHEVSTTSAADKVPYDEWKEAA